MNREEAIKIFQRTKKILSIPNSGAERTIEALDMAIEALSADRPSGEWIYGTDPLTGEKDCKAWTCSICGGKYPWQPNYCPNCGAKMGGK